MPEDPITRALKAHPDPRAVAGERVSERTLSEVEEELGDVRRGLAALTRLENELLLEAERLRTTERGFSIPEGYRLLPPSQ